MRARKRNWTAKELDTNDRIIREPESKKGEWKKTFENENPIHVEIGCGKGRFITQTAEQNKDINYIAVEREEHVIVSGMRNSKELDVKLAFILGDVSGILNIFGEQEIHRLYINFCDPWPNRKKWQKRRLTHRNFLAMYKTILSENGSVHFKTDNQELFDFSVTEFQESGWILKEVTRDLHHSDFKGNIMTEYEEKFSSQGMPIYRLEAYLK